METITIILIGILIAVCLPRAITILFIALVGLPLLLVIAICLPFLALGSILGSKTCKRKFKEVLSSEDDDDDEDDWDWDHYVNTSSTSNGTIIVNGKTIKCDRCDENACFMGSGKNRCRRHK